jgi:uncharacterized protein
LARSARPEHIFQISLYGDLLGSVQGRPAKQGFLMLGTADPMTPYNVESFSLHEVRYYVRRAARRLEAFAADLPAGLTPEPCGYCRNCNWLAACETRWERADHLCRVAGITKKQTQRLVEAGISTASMLAKLNGLRIAGIAPETLARLAQQARLQKQSALTGFATFEIIPHQPGFGFDKLPVADPGDLFFDFEGDPMHPGGLEYLCGVLWRAAVGEEEGALVPDHPHLRFRAFWAHDRVQEKHAFAELMALIMARLARSPGANLYHYAPYEKTALRRLASMHATAETTVDELLRTNRMVDLYRVVRESVRVGEPGYSIKNLERFYMPARTTALQGIIGDDHLDGWDRRKQLQLREIRFPQEYAQTLLVRTTKMGGDLCIKSCQSFEALKLGFNSPEVKPKNGGNVRMAIKPGFSPTEADESVKCADRFLLVILRCARDRENRRFARWYRRENILNMLATRRVERASESASTDTSTAKDTLPASSAFWA